MRTLLSLLRCDFTNARRDSILLYVILSPLLLALGIALFVPAGGSIGSVDVTITAGPGISDETIAILEKYVNVQRADSQASLRKAVGKPGDVPGLYKDEDTLVLLFEGNEQEEIRAIAESAVRAVSKQESSLEPHLTFTHEQVGKRQFYLRETLALMMIMLSSLIGGMTVGFNIVEERGNQVTKALSVTPVRMRAYLGSKAVFAGILGLVVSIASTIIIMGFSLPWGRLLLSVAASTMIAALFGFIMGRYADNQVSALGLTKILMPLYLTIPVVSIFIPLKFHWFFTPFPQYWLFAAFGRLLVPGLPSLGGFWLSLVLYTAAAAALLLLMGRAMRRVIGIK